MTFWRDFFEELNENVNGIVYFVDKSSLKPLGIGTIRLKLPSFLDFLLHDVLYLPELWRNFLFFVHIRRQGHSIHMFDAIVEIRRASNNMVVMIRSEGEKLLKLKGTYAFAQNFAYLSHHEGTLSFNLLCHAIFGHINYDSLQMLKKNGVSSFPTIPRKLKKCDACILGKHNKQH